MLMVMFFIFNLHKALYGLKKAPHAWLEKLRSSIFHKLGFTASLVNDCLFSKISATGDVHLLAYVNAIVVTGSDWTAIENVINCVNVEV